MANKKALDYIVEKTKELIGAPTCCDEAKAAAQAWLDAVGTENQAAETERYFAELEEDIMPIENLIAFSDSDAGREYFGAEAAADIAAHAKEIQKNGAKYCDLSLIHIYTFSVPPAPVFVKISTAVDTPA